MIKVTDKYYIRVETSPCICYTLYKKVLRRSKDGKKEYDDYESCGFFSSLKGALNGLDDKMVADALEPLSGDITDALAEVVASRNRLTDIIKRVIPELENENE